ncbi:MAG: diacylglycerol kinase [Deltaproteobacteria bacterium]|jgi:diacylglycerol kinase (ATP)|nr:diacylglycerol kinase [Deltaproteobacteria bacterium]
MKYSLSGLKLAFKKEESIRLELIALIILLIVMAFVPWPVWKKAALVAVFLLVPLTELVNSAIEDICDLVSPGIHPSVKAAKDKGSAAVLVAIVMGVVCLVALIAWPA